MATWRIIVQKKWFYSSSFKEILSNLRKFYLRLKEMCEIGSESPDHTRPNSADNSSLLKRPHQKLPLTR